MEYKKSLKTRERLSLKSLKSEIISHIKFHSEVSNYNVLGKVNTENFIILKLKRAFKREIYFEYIELRSLDLTEHKELKRAIASIAEFNLMASFYSRSFSNCYYSVSYRYFKTLNFLMFRTDLVFVKLFLKLHLAHFLKTRKQKDIYLLHKDLSPNQNIGVFNNKIIIYDLESVTITRRYFLIDIFHFVFDLNKLTFDNEILSNYLDLVSIELRPDSKIIRAQLYLLIFRILPGIFNSIEEDKKTEMISWLKVSVTHLMENFDYE